MRLSQALNHFGTLKTLADVLDLSPSTVRDWKKSGYIPKKWQKVLIEKMKHLKPKQNFQPQISVDNLIACYGSVKSVADSLGVTPNTVYRWRDAGRIPPESLSKLPSHFNSV